jgi:hypothetical protein
MRLNQKTDLFSNRESRFDARFMLKVLVWGRFLVSWRAYLSIRICALFLTLIWPVFPFTCSALGLELVGQNVGLLKHFSGCLLLLALLH